MIKSLLLRQIQVCLGLYAQKLGIFTSQFEQKSPVIPLYRSQNDTQFLYVSAIALQLASHWQQPAMDIAKGVETDLIRQDIFSLQEDDKILTLLRIQVVSPGWLYFQVTESGIVACLEKWTKAANFPNTPFPIPPSPFPIPLQYIHARCCSLLRLGEQEGLIKLSESPLWQVMEPPAIPWLNPQQQFYLGHPAEQRLISQLLAIVDGFYLPEKLNFVQIIEAFEGFYGSCRIFGAVKTQNPPLAQARLGLISVTRLLLEVLLEKHFGAVAPTEF